MSSSSECSSIGSDTTIIDITEANGYILYDNENLSDVDLEWCDKVDDEDVKKCGWLWNVLSILFIVLIILLLMGYNNLYMGQS